MIGAAIGGVALASSIVDDAADSANVEAANVGSNQDGDGLETGAKTANSASLIAGVDNGDSGVETAPSATSVPSTASPVPPTPTPVPPTPTPIPPTPTPDPPTPIPPPPTPIPPTPTPTPTPTRPPGIELSWSDKAVNLRGQIVRILTMYCPPGGTLPAPVWGGAVIQGVGAVYSDDSAVCVAAVQQGLITPGAGGNFRLQVVPAQDDYQGVTANGVASSRWASWPGGYILH